MTNEATEANRGDPDDLSPKQPSIVVMADELKIKGSPEGVHVVGRKQITQWLLNQPQMLVPKEVDTIYGVARRRSTRVG